MSLESNNEEDSPRVSQARNLGSGVQPNFFGQGNQNVVSSGTIQYIESYHYHPSNNSEGQSSLSLIRDWLSSQSSPFNTRSFNRHARLLDQRIEGTGKWMIERQEYLRWTQDTQESHRILWIHGILGSGKSVLTRFLIEHLLTITEQKGDEVCIFFYFEDDEPEQPTLSHILAHLMHQIVQIQQRRKRDIADRLVKKHEEYHAYGRQAIPSVEEYIDVFKSQLAAFRRVYVVLDAFGSCRDFSLGLTQRKILRTFESLPSHVKLLLTSRSGLAISKQLQSRANYEISLHPHPNDIKLLLHGHIKNSDNLRRIIDEGQKSDANFGESVYAYVRDASRDMFLLAKMIIDDLSRQRNLSDFRRAMEAPPRSQSSAFHSAIERIKQQEETDIDFAKFVLTCLIFATRPLTIDELVHSFAIQFSEKASNREYDRSEDALALCNGLVVVESTTSQKYVRIVHESAHGQIQNQKLLYEDPHEFIAGLCLKYLLSDDFKEAVQSDKTLRSRLERFTFLDYAANNFATHLHRNGKTISQRIEKQVMRLLTQPGKLNNWFQVVQGKAQAQITSVPAAIFLNLYVVAEELIKGNIDVNSTNENGATALHWAARLGNGSSIEFLINFNARLDLKDIDGNTPLHKAVINEYTCDAARHSSVIRQLLVADPGIMNMKNKNGYTPFYWAMRYKPTWVIELLAEYQPDTSIDGISDYSPVRDVMKFVSSESDKIRIMRNLLKKGANLSRPALDGWHPLVDAAEHGEDELAKLFIGHNSPVDIENNEGHTPLRQAIHYGHLSLVKLLVAHKADVNGRTRDGRTLLIEAVQDGQASAVWLLLDNGANSNEKDETGSTTLHWAVRTNNSSLVWLMLAKNADLKIRDGTGFSALDWAIEGGESALVWLLLSRGALVNERSTDIEGLSPLHRSAKRGHQSITKLLLSNKAEINIRDEAGLTALAHATRQQNQEMMALLINEGALCGVKDNGGATVLHHALRSMRSSDRTDLMKILFSAKADPNTQDSCQRTPLMLAAENGYQFELCYLLYHGADREIRDSEGRTARDLAVAGGFEPIVDFLDNFK